MNRLFTQAPFVDFGPCGLHIATAPRRLQRVQGSRPAMLRSAVRQQCPRQPGVYGMIDPHGELVYVGKAKNLRCRLLTYFRPKSRDRKAGRILTHARSIIWEPWPDEFAALHRELELIRRWRPYFNVQGKPRTWQYAYVCLGRPPAPYAFLATRPPAGVIDSFGPIRSGRLAREAMRRLNDWFRLRDCPQAQQMTFADQSDLFQEVRAPGCLRLELQTCLGPCAAACSQRDYSKQVRAAQGFLAGRDLALLNQLRRTMSEAAAEEKFERAALLRDKLVAFDWLNRQLERMRQAEAMGTVVYPVQGFDSRWRWYLCHTGRVVACVIAAASPPAADHSAKLAKLAQENANQQRPSDWVAGVTLLAAWFRKRPKDLRKLVPLLP